MIESIMVGLNALVVGLLWAKHDSFYSKIRSYYNTTLTYMMYAIKNCFEGKKASIPDFKPEKIFNLSFYAKLFKYVMFADVQLFAVYLVFWSANPIGDLTIFLIVFNFYWWFIFDQAHAKFHIGRFMTWDEFLDRHFIHRTWQYIERKLK